MKLFGWKYDENGKLIKIDLPQKLTQEQREQLGFYSNEFNFMGYRGSVEHSTEDNVLHGTILGIKGLVTYEANDLISLYKEFKTSVKEYIKILNN